MDKIMFIKCLLCGGSGIYEILTCTHCGGSGMIYENDKESYYGITDSSNTDVKRKGSQKVSKTSKKK